MSLFSHLFGTTTRPRPTSGASLAVVDVHERRRRQAAAALLTDVRGPTEWNQGRQLQELGYQRACNVTRGMNAWASAGLPVSR